MIPPPGANGFPPYQEIMVPGSKVGLVIGKGNILRLDNNIYLASNSNVYFIVVGGETIKMLQEKTGAKMVIIQDGPGQELVITIIAHYNYIALL